REVYCLEERCRGKGDAVCRLVGRPVEDWGETIAPHLPFYQTACLDGAMAHLTAEVAKVERKLRARRRQADRVSREDRRDDMILESEAMARVLDVAQRVAQVDSTVLLTGESGVGKERVARF